MVVLNKFFASVLLAVTCASGIVAAPQPLGIKFTTHGKRELANRLTLETYNPESTYETFADGLDHPHTKRQEFVLKDAAVDFIVQRLGREKKTMTFRSGYSGESLKNAFLKQSHNGVSFANAVANVAFDARNRVVSFGSSFVTPKSISSSSPTLSVADAIAKAEAALGGKYNDHPASLEYFVKPDQSVVLTHVVQIVNAAADEWVEAFVDAHTGELVSIVDFVSHASYRVLPINKQIIAEGFETVTDPADIQASPYGWHNTGTGTTQTTNTGGNNVVAYKSSASSGTAAQTSATNNYNYVLDPAQAPTVTNNLKAAVVNAFYIVNKIHDLTYRYGFTEKTYNFQQNNYGKGGSGNDRVLVSVQDSSGTNNANFATPADGQSGQMRMYLWTTATPQRDGSVENDVVIHEMTHGITNRMTGGGTGRCLQTTEAGGMGEGWSDALADVLAKNSSAVPDFVVGRFVANKAGGIRAYPYSTSATVNPYKYSSVASLSGVHAIGTVWANLLHNVYAALVAQHGWSATALTDPTGTAGNNVWLHLFLDALALQPCNPTMPQAREAWIQADANRYAGANKCLLWKVFASRGFGVGASGYKDSSSVPTGC